jgi:hypothetical protein
VQKSLDGTSPDETGTRSVFSCGWLSFTCSCVNFDCLKRGDASANERRTGCRTATAGNNFQSENNHLAEGRTCLSLSTALASVLLYIRASDFDEA